MANKLRKVVIPVLVIALCIITPAVDSFGMDFRWISHTPSDKGRANAKDVILLTGEIRRGDSERFRAFVLENLDDYSRSKHQIYLSSNGGDVVEAIKIGEIVKGMYAEVGIPIAASCSSACFYIFVSAVDRSLYGAQVGVHRAYFDKQYFAGLSPSEAEKRQFELTRLVARFLENNSVPAGIIEKMNRTPSTRISLLTPEELDGIGQYASWFEEFLISKCKYAPDLLQRLELAIREDDSSLKYSQCRKDIITKELTDTLLPLLKTPKDTSIKTSIKKK